MFRRVPAVVSTIKRKKMTYKAQQSTWIDQAEFAMVQTYVFLVAFLFSVFQGS